tara:strand:- start:59 stop:283 length:225 start_codon:yes stop_codon:yes gene_type:complete
VKVRKLKSLRNQVTRVRSANPTTNIIRAAILYLVPSDTLLNKNVSAAKEFEAEILCRGVFSLEDENIFEQMTFK